MHDFILNSKNICQNDKILSIFDHKHSFSYKWIIYLNLQLNFIYKRCFNTQIIGYNKIRYSNLFIFTYSVVKVYLSIFKQDLSLIMRTAYSLIYIRGTIFIQSL